MPRTGLSGDELKNRAIELTSQRIRADGFENLRLIDIARELGISHVALYSYFTDKSALLGAVSEKWLADLDAKLAEISHGGAPVSERIVQFFLALHRVKREHVRLEPELYKAFNFSVEERKPFVRRHLENVNQLLLGLSTEALREARSPDLSPEVLKDALLNATFLFTEPQSVRTLMNEDREGLLLAMLGLMLQGLGLKV